MGKHNKKLVFIHPRTHNNFVDFIEELSREYQIEIYSYENNKPIKNKNIKYYKLKNIVISKKNRIYFPSIIQLFKIINSKKIITLKGLNSLETIFSLIICRLKFIKPIIFVQKINFKLSLKYFYVFFYRYVLSCDKLKIISATKIGYEESKLITKCPYYLPFGIKIKKNIKKIKHENFNLLCVSKIQKRKNIIEIIEVFSKLVKINKLNLRLNIASRGISDGKYYSEVINLIEQLNLKDKIKISLNLNKIEMDDLYLKSDLYLLLSFDEPAAISHLEAINFGVPVFLNKFNGTSDYINNKSEGIIINTKNFEEVYKGLYILLNNKDYIKMGVKARNKLIKNFDVKIIVREFKKILNE